MLAHRQLVHLTVLCWAISLAGAVPARGDLNAGVEICFAPSVSLAGAAPARGDEVGDPARGQKLVKGLGCLTCHTVRGEGGGGETKAPEWANLYGTTAELEGGAKVEVTEAYLRESITLPDARVVKGFPAGKMPNRFTHLPEKDIASLVAYIKSLSEKGLAELKAAGGGQLVAGASQEGGVEPGPAKSVVWVWILLGFSAGITASSSVSSMSRNISWAWITLLVPIPALGLASGVAWAEYATTGHSEKEIHVVARQWAYDPPIVKVRLGDRVTMTLKSKDVLHGFYLDGYGIDKEIRPDQTVRFTIVANKAGRFSYRCSRTCGVFHPFMIGNFIVEPNYLFPGSIGLCFGLGLATFLYIANKQEQDHGA